MSNLTPVQEDFYKPIKEKFVNQIDEKTFIREVNFAIQILKKNTYLQGASAESVLESVVNISQTGLTLNPVLKYAYLIPRKVKNQLVCVLEPGYQGLIKLATDTDNITSIEVQLVYEGDDVEIDFSSDRKVKKHIPYLLTGKDQGKILFGYSIAILKDGNRHVEIMSLSQIHDVRGCSDSYKNYVNKKSKGEWASSVWVSDEPEMCRKTIVKRHFKYLPKSDNKKLEKAIELDNSDYDFPASFEQGNMIESLLLTSTIPNKVERQIHDTLYNGEFTKKRAEECIQYLKENQQDSITSGNGNYSQGDIQKKLTEVMQDEKK